MRKCVKKHRSRNLIVSYMVGCVLAIICALCTGIGNNDSSGFIFGLYLFTFCQVIIWEPLSVCMILIIHKTKILPIILDSFWLCIVYAFLPSLLMIIDALCGNIWIGHFNVDSIFCLVLVYMSYYFATIVIAYVHRLLIHNETVICD